MLNLLTFFPTFDVMWFVADQAGLIQLDRFLKKIETLVPYGHSFFRLRDNLWM